MRVLVFGDSIVQGMWDIEGGWAERLRKYYDSLAINNLRNNTQPEVFNLGVSSGTSQSNLDRLEDEIKARIYRGSEITILISTGANDSYQTEDGSDNSKLEDYIKNMSLIAKKARIYSRKIMFVGLVAVDESKTNPVFWRDINYTNAQLERFENAMAKVAQENTVTYISIHKKFKAKLDSGENLLADGLHPNESGHEFIYQQVRPELDKLLAGQ